MVVQFSHSKLFSPEADRAAIQQIHKQFRDAHIITPTNYQEQFDKLNGGDRMEFCFELIELADIFVFVEYQDYIGRGVYREVRHAEKLGKPIFLLRDEKFYDNITVEINNEDDWTIRFGRVKFVD